MRNDDELMDASNCEIAACGERNGLKRCDCGGPCNECQTVLPVLKPVIVPQVFVREMCTSVDLVRIEGGSYQMGTNDFG